MEAKNGTSVRSTVHHFLVKKVKKELGCVLNLPVSLCCVYVAFFPKTSHYKFFERPLWEEQRPQISLQQTMQTLRQPAGLRSEPPISKAPSEELGLVALAGLA